MDPEFWVTLAAVFMSGGAIGAAGTLFAQWLVKKMDGPDQPRRTLESAEMELLRGDLHDLSVLTHDLDARLRFQERLLGGSLTVEPPETLQYPADADAGDQREN